MKKKLSSLASFTTFILTSSAIAQHKVVVAPLGSNDVAGSDGQLQYNDGDKVAGADVYYDKASGKVGIAKTAPAESLDVDGNVKADSFIGDGSALSGIGSTLARETAFLGSTLAITVYNQDAASGLLSNVNNKGRKFLIIASINVNNTIEAASPHDATLRFDLRSSGSVRRSETVILKSNSRHIVNFQYLEDNPAIGTIPVDVVVTAATRVDLETRYLFVIEL